MVVLIGLTGWLVDRSMERLSGTIFVQYETSTQGAFFRTTVTNASLGGSVDRLTISVSCQASAPCLERIGSLPNTPYARFELLEVAPIEMAISQSSNSEEAQVEISLLSGSSVTIVVKLLPSSQTPLILFQPEPSIGKNISIVRGSSIALILTKNYTNILIITLFFAAIMLVIYIIIPPVFSFFGIIYRWTGAWFSK